MKLMHSDSRRDLYEWPVAKRLVIREECTIGNHHHEKKTEVFVLTDGEGLMELNGNVSQMKVGREVTVLPGVRHSFRLSAGSVLLCLASEPYDPRDDYR